MLDACHIINTAAPVHAGTGWRRPPLVVADSSMMVGVKPLAALGFEGDARGCRQIGPAVDLLAARRHAGTLPRLVVLAVGANGAVSGGDIERALAVVGRRRMLGLVTSAGSAASAQAMRSAAARHRGRVVLVDWAWGPGRRYGGDVHIGPAGEAVLARYIWRRTRPWQPPPRSLGVPRSAAGARDCGGRRLRVFVTRGARRILCARAREIARTAPRGWRHFAWRVSGPPPWTDVYARADSAVVIAARPRLGAASRAGSVSAAPRRRKT